MKLVNIGLGNMVNAEKITAVVSPDSAPIKRLVQDGKETGNVVDATHGRKTKSVIITDNGLIILSYLQTDTVSSRVNGANLREE